MNRVLGQGQRFNFTWDEPNTNEWEGHILHDLAFSFVTRKLRRLNFVSDQALQLRQAGETRDNAPCTRMWVSRDFSRLPQMESMLAGYLNRAFDEDPLSSAEAPAGYTSKNSNNRKLESARVRWEEGKGGSLCHIMHSRWRRISEEDWN